MEKIIETLLNEWDEKELPYTIERETDLSSYIGMKVKKVIVLSGFRRTGKTYLLLHLIKKLLKQKSKEQVIHINFEDERIPLKTEFLTKLLPIIKQKFGDSEFLFLDEIHVIPNWGKWARRITDNEKTRMFVTGSSSKMSSKEIPTELRGRVLEVKIFPLSFKEFLKFKNIAIDWKTIEYSENEKAKLIRQFDEYLKFGGMPEVVIAEKTKKPELIHSYYNTVVRRDIIERYNIKNEEGMKTLLNLLLNSSSYSISKMYNTFKSLNIEIGKTTIQNYIGYIENSYFMYSVPIFSFKIKDELQYPRKIYFVDNGFINFLSRKYSKNQSKLMENLVFTELKRRESEMQEICYWKNKLQEEVDFVIKTETKVKQLIQVCYDISDYDTKKRELRALIKASKELKCKNLLIITNDKKGTETIKGKKIKYVPLWKWLLENKNSNTK